jgi:hypothetical protein
VRPRSCWPNSQLRYSDDDIALWVAANATSFSGRSHSASWPLHAVTSPSASAVVAPEPNRPAMSSTTSTVATPPTIHGA